MRIFRTQIELKHYLKDLQNKASVGFVPTMGALHNGHLSLIENSKKKCAITVCSIFVNPTQFNDQSDFEKYPIDHSGDIHLLESAGCDVLFLPQDINEVYQNEEIVSVELGELANVLEGEHRPGHFNGVIRVVKLLFEIIQPQIAFFGLKDYQQFLVIKKMVEKLQMNIEIVGCEIVREKSGLAMSSRNKRLTEDELQKALVLQKALLFCKKESHKMNLLELEKQCLEILKEGGVPEYFKICDANSLQSINDNYTSKNLRAFVAANVGEVRLIDNIAI